MDKQINHKRVLSDLNDLEKDVVHIRKNVQNLKAAIEIINNMPNTKHTTGASVAEFKAKSSNMLICMKPLYAEKQKLRGEIENLEDDVVRAAMSVMTQKFNHLGCILNAENKDGVISFSFDFGKGYTVVMQLENSHMSLSAITPHTENFAILKEHLDASQDLLGLLSYYSSLSKKCSFAKSIQNK